MVLTVAETGSTNADLLVDAAAGASEGRWLRAERQTQGRGRLARAWESPAGNLYASTIVRLRAGDPPAPTLSLVAGVALQEAAATHVPEAGVLLKWPNDLMAGAAKLAGILLERAGDAVVIGFGVNLAHHPHALERPVTSLAAFGPVPDPAAFLETLAARFADWLARWREEGVGSIRAAWETRAHARGTPLSATTPDGAIRGTFEGLSDDGALRLRSSDGGITMVYAGDVFPV